MATKTQPNGNAPGLKSVEWEKWTDMQAIAIDLDLPVEQRVSAYRKQVEDLCCLRCGKTPVKLTFSESGKPLSERLADYIASRMREL